MSTTISPEEYEIYALVVDSIYANGNDSIKFWVTIDSTVHNHFRGNISGRDSKGRMIKFGEFDALSFICSSLSNVDYDQIEENYNAVNRSHYTISIDSVKTSLRCFQLSTDSVRSIMSTGGWELFYALFPKCNGIVRFSRVGFDLKREYAIAYVDHVRGDLVGGGYYVLFRNESGRWRLKCKVQDWVS